MAEDKDETTKLKVLSKDNPEPDDLDDDEDEDEDEEGDDEGEETEGVNVYTIFLRGSQLPVPAIDTRENDQLVFDFGAAFRNKDQVPFFSFTGDPDEGFVGMALVRIDDVAAIQSVVTEGELQDYLTRDEEEDEVEVEESAAEKARREAEEKRERRRQRREQEAAAAAGRVKAGNRGPKGGKGLKEIV